MFLWRSLTICAKKGPDSSFGDSRLLHACLTDKKNDLTGLLERVKMSVVEQEGTSPHLNRIKTSQFRYRFRKLEENPVEIARPQI